MIRSQTEPPAGACRAWPGAPRLCPILQRMVGEPLGGENSRCQGNTVAPLKEP
jgi:hypothetical protein